MYMKLIRWITIIDINYIYSHGFMSLDERKQFSIVSGFLNKILFSFSFLAFLLEPFEFGVAVAVVFFVLTGVAVVDF